MGREHAVLKWGFDVGLDSFPRLVEPSLGGGVVEHLCEADLPLLVNSRASEPSDQFSFDKGVIVLVANCTTIAQGV